MYDSTYDIQAETIYTHIGKWGIVCSHHSTKLQGCYILYNLKYESKCRDLPSKTSIT